MFHAIILPHTTTSFAPSYEDYAQVLMNIPRLYIEPDGSFVWVSALDSEHQLNGQITDDGQRVMFVELRGTCPFSGVEPVLVGLGWPEQPVRIQLLPNARILDDVEFRALLDGTSCWDGM